MRSLWEEHRRKRSQGCALRNPVRDEERGKAEKQTGKEKREVCGDPGPKL